MQVVLLTFWFINIIPMFFQVSTSVLYYTMRNRVPYLSLAIIKIATFITLLLESAMGITLIIISFHITS